ncbi:YebG family protein [Kosakonia pseudosacchari]|uniref:YebG family protein n=1 Tax=Kosakonia pseudosacchari TaxID=1646340 RepID=UPI0022F04868|nr:YebG family protein [Kosakonia pseudosacchari]WBU51165.1 YebG family protein [Kosakonia pseudosacchari]
MAVEVKYVVIREGEEKMSFASKKEADAYDKMLDLAEVLGDWLATGPVALEDNVRDEMALWLAEQKEALNGILKSGKLPGAETEDAAPADSSAAETADAVDIKTAAKRVKVA